MNKCNVRELHCLCVNFFKISNTKALKSTYDSKRNHQFDHPYILFNLINKSVKWLTHFLCLSIPIKYTFCPFEAYSEIFNPLVPPGEFKLKKTCLHFFFQCKQKQHMMFILNQCNELKLTTTSHILARLWTSLPTEQNTFDWHWTL